MRAIPRQNATSSITYAIGVIAGLVLLARVALAAPTTGPSSSHAATELAPSARALEAVPDLLDRLSSNDPQVTLKLIDQLVIRHPSHDVVGYRLRYDLPDEDYGLILASALSSLRPALLDQESKRAALSKLEHLARVCPLPQVGPLLVPWLQDSDPIVQLVSLRMVQALNARDLAPQVARFLESGDDVKRVALEVLVSLKSPLALDTLFEKLRDEPNDKPTQRYKALQDIVVIGDKRAVRHVEPLLTEKKDNTSYWVLDTLYKLDARESKERIWEVMQQQPDQRSFVMYAQAILAKWDDTRAIPPIMERLTSSKLEEHFETVQIIERMDIRQMGKPVLALVREQAALPRNQRINANVLAGMIGLIGRLKIVEAIPLLRQMAGPGLNWGLAGYAASQLGELQAAEAIPELVALLGRPETDSQAIIALAKIGTPEAVAVVVEQLRKKPRGSISVDALICLNVASNQHICERLKTTALQNVRMVKTVKDYLSQVKKELGISVVFAGSASDRFLDSSADRLVRQRVATALHEILLGPDYAWYLDGDTVHVCPIPEALAFWEGWLGRHPATK
jgi:HEAT repeat protein